MQKSYHIERINELYGKKELEEKGLKRYFGMNLADIFIQKLLEVDETFDHEGYIQFLEEGDIYSREMISRTELHAAGFRKFLHTDYGKALEILVQILGPENEKETGMFTTWYWLWPVSKFIEVYGYEDIENSYDSSIRAIEEITKRHTGEFAIRPFIRANPEQTLQIIKLWAKSENVHVRRLATEGIRPRLPWAKKLDLFVEDPQPIFDILEILKQDKSKFVQKSVANNLNDYLKENFTATMELLERWKNENPAKETEWIIKHATRNLRKKELLYNEKK